MICVVFEGLDQALCNLLKKYADLTIKFIFGVNRFRRKQIENKTADG